VGRDQLFDLVGSDGCDRVMGVLSDGMLVHNAFLVSYQES